MKGKKIFEFYGLKWRFIKKGLEDPGEWVCLGFITGDTETSNNHAEDETKLITWVTSIQLIFAGKFYLFRKPSEFVNFLIELEDKVHANELNGPRKKIIIFFHNMSFDISYLGPYLMQLNWTAEDYEREAAGQDQVFRNVGIIEDVNRFLTFTAGIFEFRCSYRLSNMSLEAWSEALNTPHKKKIGFYDYDKIIYQDEDIFTPEEMEYMQNDVYALEECINGQNEYFGHDTVTMPLTFTSYGRIDMRRSCNINKYYYECVFKESALEPKVYLALLHSYAGGLTHNNRHYKNVLVQVGQDYYYVRKDKESIKVDLIGHGDFRSHYPSCIRCHKYPIGKFRSEYNYLNDWPIKYNIDRILKWSPKYSTMSVIQFTSARLKDFRTAMPIMQLSKCEELPHTKDLETYRIDNGRVLDIKCKPGGSWIMYLDNLTLKWINKQYDLEYTVLQVWKCINTDLPEEITQVIDHYFKGKSDKKIIYGVTKDKYGEFAEETIKAAFDLGQDKIKLNGFYGIFSTNPIRYNMLISDNFEFESDIEDEDEAFLPSVQRQLDEYYGNRNNFAIYSIGVWCTAYARDELLTFCEAVGNEHVLYCDTDSIFYIKTPEVMERIEALNTEHNKTAPYITDVDGKKIYYDVFEAEDDLVAFKGLHSKCYGGVIVKKDKETGKEKFTLKLTIAGVPARTLVGMDGEDPVYFTREEELFTGIKTYEEAFKWKLENKDRVYTKEELVDALDKLEPEHTFYINTGLMGIYVGAHGANTPRIPSIVNVNGHEIETAGGCVLRKLPYKQIHDVLDDEFYFEV